jgi:hypothetical protein
MNVHSYPSIYNLGHAAIAELLKGPVIVEEKVDGSQFSFAKNEEGELSCRSKGAQINMLAPEGMFEQAVATVRAVAHLMRPGFTYRGEYLAKPKHNALAYDRVPVRNVIIFDVNTGLETYCSPHDRKQFADELGLETVRVLYMGILSDAAKLREMLDFESVLGGQKIEGVVIKPMSYDLFGRDKKVLFGKFVSEAFKEVHSKTWDAEHKTPGQTDILEILATQYGTLARWQKALIHLRERGEIQNDPRDIGALMKETPEDVSKECADEIKSALYAWAWPQLRRRLTRGLPEWYKEQLLKSQFETK